MQLICIKISLVVNCLGYTSHLIEHYQNNVSCGEKLLTLMV